MNSKIDLEFYYMSGKPIDLRHLGLGVVYQPKLRDFIDNKIDISFFSQPFLFDKEIISNKKDGVDELVKDLGKLGFLIIYSELATLEQDENILDLLVKSLKFIYKTDDIIVAKTICKIIIDGSIIIGDSELQLISDIVIEMLRVDKEEIIKKIQEKNKEAERDALDDEFERRAKAHAERLRKKNNSKDFSLMDIVNVVVHSQANIDYDRVFDMTLYQLKNSYETLIKKEMFTINLMHRISPNFKPSEELKLWEENAHIVKSNLNQI